MDNYACCRSRKGACITSGACECTQGEQEQSSRPIGSVVEVKPPFSYGKGEGRFRLRTAALFFPYQVRRYQPVVQFVPVNGLCFGDAESNGMATGQKVG